MFLLKLWQKAPSHITWCIWPNVLVVYFLTRKKFYIKGYANSKGELGGGGRAVGEGAEDREKRRMLQRQGGEMGTRVRGS